MMYSGDKHFPNELRFSIINKILGPILNVMSLSIVLWLIGICTINTSLVSKKNQRSDKLLAYA